MLVGPTYGGLLQFALLTPMPGTWDEATGAFEWSDGTVKGEGDTSP